MMEKRLFAGKKILVTGGSGFIGRNLLDFLDSEGAEIINIARSSKNLPGKNIVADLTITDFSFLDRLDFDYVVHLAAFSSPARSKNNEEVLALNTISTSKLFQKLLEKNVKKVIFFSTGLVYEASNERLTEESPLETEQNLYVKSKILSEKEGADFIARGLPLVIFRLSNSYGPYQDWEKEKEPTLIPQLIEEALTKKQMHVWNPSPIRDYIYVDDVVRAITSCFNNEFNGFVNLGTGKGSSVGEAVDIITKLTGVTPIYLHKPLIKNTDRVMNIEKFKNIFFWAPEIPLEDGLSRTLEYYKKVVPFKKT
jgi:nucleoside-diphosphate-sugar epimerase